MKFTSRLSFVLAGIVTICVSSACATQSATTSTSSGDRDTQRIVKGSCSDGESIVGGLEAIPVSSAKVLPTLSWGKDQSLELVNATQLKGACANQLTKFRMSNLFFGDTAVVTLGGQNGLDFTLNQRATLAPDHEMHASGGHPAWPNATFVMASPVDNSQPEAGVGTYVGLWKKGNESTVLAYRRASDGSFSTPSVVLTSSKPLRSVTYFPAIDSPSGRLGVVQENADSVLLLSIDWFHQGAFPAR